MSGIAVTGVIEKALKEAFTLCYIDRDSIVGKFFEHGGLIGGEVNSPVKQLEKPGQQVTGIFGQIAGIMVICAFEQTQDPSLQGSLETGPFGVCENGHVKFCPERSVDCPCRGLNWTLPIHQPTAGGLRKRKINRTPIGLQWLTGE